MRQQDEREPSGGGESELAELYTCYGTSIMAYARLHVSTWEDAEEIVLEAFTEAWKQDNLSWLAEKQRLVWLRSVAQHKIVDRYRRSLHVSLLPFDQLGEAVQAGETPSPEQVVIHREELEQLYMAVSRLSLLQQQVIQLRVGDGLRFAEIALLLNKRETAVRKIFSRTVAHLRRAFDQPTTRKDPSDDTF